MKNKLLNLLLLIISILSISIIKVMANNNLMGKVIFLDAGHGGMDPGAVYKDIYEADINLAITKKLEEKLGSNGAIVYLIRDGDYDLSNPKSSNHKRSDLEKRARLINESNCDLYVSIHLNSENTGLWHGAQAFYDDVNPENEKIANIFQEYFKINLKTKREYKKITDRYLFRNVKRPGILAEVGFLSNDNDRYLLLQDSYQEKVANTLYEAINHYFSLK